MDATPKASNASVILYACLASILGQSALFIYLPSLPQMQSEFGVDAAAMQDSISIYALGYGFSQLVWGALSDRFGRKSVAIAGLTVFGITSLGLTFSGTYFWFQLLRLIQGIGAGCGTSVSRAALRDVLVAVQLAQAMSYISICFAGALGIAPFIGGQFAKFLSWRSDFGLLALLAGLVLVFVLSQLRETNKLDLDLRMRAFKFRLLLRNYFQILTSWTFLLPACACAIATGMISTYDTVSPFALEKNLGLSPVAYGNTSLVITLAYLLGAIAVNLRVIAWGQAFFLRLGLLIGLAAALGMLGLGLVGYFSVYSLLTPMFFVVLSCSMVIPICFALSLNAFPNQAGLASALIGVVQQEGGALIVFLATFIPGNSQTPLAAVLIGMAVLNALLLREQWRTALVKPH